MFNPFKAIGGAIAKAGRAVANVVKAPFSRGTKASTPAPKPPAVVRTPAPKPPAPKAPTPVRTPTPPAPTPAPTKRPPLLPPSTTGGATGIVGGHSRDERILGEDSDHERILIEAIKEFEADFGTGGLGKDAQAFIDHPSFSAILDKYVGPSGFSSDQWLAGMKDPSNISIHKVGDSIDISFDADFEIDGDYDLGGRSPSAVF